LNFYFIYFIQIQYEKYIICNYPVNFFSTSGSIQLKMPAMDGIEFLEIAESIETVMIPAINNFPMGYEAFIPNSFNDIHHLVSGNFKKIF
jgi:hypothetical protein